MRKLIIFIFFTLIVIFFFFISKDVNESSQKFNFDNKTIDFEDSLILKKKILKDIEVKKVAKSSVRNTIKFYRYKKQFNMYITKINLYEDKSLDNVIYFNEEITSTSSFVTYINLQSNSFYNIKFRAEKLESVSKIIFSMTGNGQELKKVVFNKDFISYCLPLHTFSLQYDDKNNPIDIFIATDTPSIISKKGVPFIISFYKKEKSIYLFLITPIEKNTELGENILSELVNY